MNNSEQLGFDFAAPATDGYAVWQWQHAEAVERIAATWDLPINRRVRLKLTNIDSEFEGDLRLAEMPSTLNRKRPLALKLTPLIFSSLEIESCTVIA